MKKLCTVSLWRSKANAYTNQSPFYFLKFKVFMLNLQFKKFIKVVLRPNE